MMRDYELLPPVKTIVSNLYCQQLMRIKQEVEKKWPERINRKGVVFHYDNARPHISLATQQILKEFDCVFALPSARPPARRPARDAGAARRAGAAAELTPILFGI
ncbi:Histone-lysine N-methyltransferase SETMAR [Eumeta japonica]|uniref:Histone-lysine N-methyltransferase SETMAR n=1 Tax=Eumeta variegata TaxID=151549 RepID=A0A4C1V0J2_EUMVA|nr:Histone-lysine N-methyltransferase SETMAR [Eumeta japonica]